MSRRKRPRVEGAAAAVLDLDLDVLEVPGSASDVGGFDWCLREAARLHGAELKHAKAKCKEAEESLDAAMKEAERHKKRCESFCVRLEAATEELKVITRCPVCMLPYSNASVGASLSLPGSSEAAAAEDSEAAAAADGERGGFRLALENCGHCLCETCLKSMDETARSGPTFRAPLCPVCKTPWLYHTRCVPGTSVPMFTTHADGRTELCLGSPRTTRVFL